MDGFGLVYYKQSLVYILLYTSNFRCFSEADSSVKSTVSYLLKAIRCNKALSGFDIGLTVFGPTNGIKDIHSISLARRAKVFHMQRSFFSKPVILTSGLKALLTCETRKDHVISRSDMGKVMHKRPEKKELSWEVR